MPHKLVHFTGDDRRRIANLIELTARLKDVAVPDLLEQYVRDSLERDPIATSLRNLGGAA